MKTHTRIADLSDDALITRTKSLVQNERSTTAEVVAHLAEIDARRLYLAEACSSLFAYCTQVLHLSEYEAYTRIAAARAGRKFPLIFERLADGDVHLSAVDLLAPHLTEENHRELLGCARHRTKREVEKIVAEIAPRLPVVSMVRKLPVRPVEGPVPAGRSGPEHRPESVLSISELSMEMMSSAPEPQASESVFATPRRDPQLSCARPRTRPRIQPLSPEYYKVQFTADPATVELLRRAQDLLRHQIPNGDPATIFAMALGDLVEKLERRKAAEVGRPRAAKPASAAATPIDRKPVGTAAPNSRTIPAAVRRDVWRRNQGRCAFQSANGRRCPETGFLEFHHVKPFARGGRATADNMELRCRAHNQYEALLVFGDRTGSVVREKGVVFLLRA